MINGLHAIIYAEDADKVRAFFKDVLGFPAVDAGHGWLIFALTSLTIPGGGTIGLYQPKHAIALNK
jgi:catechol 2,3-dioxygenase-like lactoylglutathione lyase family enzyme